jgi:hypothetical protein
LDVALNEDHSQVRKDQAPENLAVLYHIALNLLKREKTAKGGIHAKQLQAAQDQTGRTIAQSQGPQQDRQPVQSFCLIRSACTGWIVLWSYPVSVET